MQIMNLASLFFFVLSNVYFLETSLTCVPVYVSHLGLESNKQIYSVCLFTFTYTVGHKKVLIVTNSATCPT